LYQYKYKYKYTNAPRRVLAVVGSQEEPLLTARAVYLQSSGLGYRLHLQVTGYRLQVTGYRQGWAIRSLSIGNRSKIDDLL
jgi:hypothetical protein